MGGLQVSGGRCTLPFIYAERAMTFTRCARAAATAAAFVVVMYRALRGSSQCRAGGAGKVSRKTM